MSKQASEFQEKAMARLYRGKEIFKPLNTGWIDGRVACVREYIANIFFYTKNGVTIMIDAGYESAPEILADAMTIGWTQNVVILEAELSIQERAWYIQAVHQFEWSKLELQQKIAASTHLENSLDFTDGVCYTGKNSAREEVSTHAAAEDHQCYGAGSSGSAMGFLPFFACSIPNFSIEEFTPSRYWFVDGVDGPWEWRMEVARRGIVAYGKLFSQRAGLVSREWYPDLTNYRRNGYDFDARYEDGLASHKEKCVMDVLLQEGPTLSKDLKRLAGFGGDGMRGFDTVITHLQMQTYITVHSFEYAQDKHGRPYGWGIARYAVTEDVLGTDVTQGAYDRSPEESKERILQHLKTLYPDAFNDDLAKLIR